MGNISPTIKINISTSPDIVEEIMLRASCSSEEVTSYKELFQELCDIFSWSYKLDPSIVEHHIDTWPNVVTMHQKQQPIHPSKVVMVKDEIEKLHIASFVYPIAYTTWVSNHVPVNKKQGTIYVCIEFYDLNGACPKDNFQTPFID